MRKVLVTMVLALLLGACASAPATVRHVLFLDDTSESPTDVGFGWDRMEELFGAWLAVAAPGSKLLLFELPDAGSPVEVKPLRPKVVPPPEPPVKLNREEFNAETLGELEDYFEGSRKTAKWSPLFEALWRLQRQGSKMGGEYEVWIRTDLLQTSDLVILDDGTLRRRTDEEIVERVLAALPPVERPPVLVRVLYAAGRTAEGRVGGEKELRLQGIFSTVVERWGSQAVWE